MAHATVDAIVLSRISDVQDEPIQLLTPINGYQDAPLVSLEKAIEPISHLFHSIERYVWIAKQNSKKAKDNLTQDESASICLYTMEFDPGPSLYQLLNRVLRSEQRDKLPEWFLYLKLFLTAIYKLPSYEGLLWRGLSNADLHSKYTIGQKIVWWGVSSCTLDRDVFENEQFLNKNGLRTIFTIQCKHGKNIAPHSYYQQKEQEILLMPGSYFHVKDYSNPASDLHRIDLEEISPPSPFVALPFYPEDTSTNTSKNAETKDTTALDSKDTGENKRTINIGSKTTTSNFETTVSIRDEKCSNRWTIKSILTILVLILLTGLPIATLIMGQIHQNECPIQTWIPQWMIVFGSVGIATFIVLAILIFITITFCSNENFRLIGYASASCLLCLLIFFFFAWLIAGSVWVFSINTNVDFNDTTSTNYCLESLYKFTFGTLITQYTLIGLIICCSICVACLGYCIQ